MADPGDTGGGRERYGQKRLRCGIKRSKRLNRNVLEIVLEKDNCLLDKEEGMIVKLMEKMSI